MDTDDDGTPDCYDYCPLDVDKVFPLLCGCSVWEEDFDGDGIPDCVQYLCNVCADDTVGPCKDAAGACTGYIQGTSVCPLGTYSCADTVGESPVSTQSMLEAVGAPDTAAVGVFTLEVTPVQPATTLSPQQSSHLAAEAAKLLQLPADNVAVTYTKPSEDNTGAIVVGLSAASLDQDNIRALAQAVKDGSFSAAIASVGLAKASNLRGDIIDSQQSQQQQQQQEQEGAQEAASAVNQPAGSGSDSTARGNGNLVFIGAGACAGLSAVAAAVFLVVRRRRHTAAQSKVIVTGDDDQGDRSLPRTDSKRAKAKRSGMPLSPEHKSRSSRPSRRTQGWE